MKLTKEEKEFIEKRRRVEEMKKADAEFTEYYDNCYCYDENGNWK